ncbi:hypothetical protein ACA910_018609 [Epithemia clementina (nom. ined.)]
MSATVERMLERKFRLDKEKARVVATAAKSNLGFGKNVLFCKKLLDECQRVAEAKGYLNEGRPLPLTRHLSYNHLSSGSEHLSASTHDDLTSQSHHEALSKRQGNKVRALNAEFEEKPEASPETSSVDPSDDPKRYIKKEMKPIQLFDGFFLAVPLPILSDNAKLPAPYLLSKYERSSRGSSHSSTHSSDGRISLNSKQGKTTKSKTASRRPSSVVPTSRWESIPHQKAGRSFNQLSRSNSDQGYHSGAGGSRWLTSNRSESMRQLQHRGLGGSSQDRPIARPPLRRGESCRGIDQPVAPPSQKYSSAPVDQPRIEPHKFQIASKRLMENPAVAGRSLIDQLPSP